MEYSLTQQLKKIPSVASGLNPYSNGILSDILYCNQLKNTHVLILILMEYSLTTKSCRMIVGENLS